MIEIWVDDVRPKPKDYIDEAKSVYEALFTLGVAWHREFAWQGVLKKENLCVLLDLDHDAGEYVVDGGDYINILKALSQPWAKDYLEEIPIKVRFHSANPVGVKNMRAIVENCPWMEEAK